MKVKTNKIIGTKDGGNILKFKETFSNLKLHFMHKVGGVFKSEYRDQFVDYYDCINEKDNLTVKMTQNECFFRVSAYATECAGLVLKILPESKKVLNKNVDMI